MLCAAGLKTNLGIMLAISNVTTEYIIFSVSPSDGHDEVPSQGKIEPPPPQLLLILFAH